jgi:hypothetical protein
MENKVLLNGVRRYAYKFIHTYSEKEKLTREREKERGGEGGGTESEKTPLLRP